MTERIDWRYPQPRSGFNGFWDRFVGPGTTQAELALQIGFALLAGAAVVIYALAADLGWSALQLIVAGVLALDMAGGVVTNACSSAKRWYHREGQGLAQHVTFVAAHVVQIALVAWLFRGQDWGYLVVVYAYLMAATVIILRAPLYLQRPVALIFLCSAFVLNSYVLLPVRGMEWFIPFLFLKLLVSHLLREEPYRPAGERGS